MVYSSIQDSGSYLKGWAKEAGLRLARMINNVSVKLVLAKKVYQLFIKNLEASPGWVYEQATGLLSNASASTEARRWLTVCKALKGSRGEG
ncbi:hypothetical protein Tco_0988247 [Tanacetum coccineum]|uniref:Uncharacterized protein n=1 Tax=Tanacetum coccineum TaxID=301880 RepID=A0ABQ5ER48_9ASTR